MVWEGIRPENDRYSDLFPHDSVTPNREKFFCFFFFKKRSASYLLLRRNRTRSLDETSTAPAATAAARWGNGTS